MMSTAFPNFEELPIRNVGGIIYRVKMPEAYVFVRLLLASKTDSFTFELAANTSPDFPFEVAGQGPFKLAQGKVIRCRIRDLMPSAPKDDVWWCFNDSGKADLSAILKSQEAAQIKQDLMRARQVMREATKSLVDLLPGFVQEVTFVYRSSERSGLI